MIFPSIYIIVIVNVEEGAGGRTCGAVNPKSQMEATIVAAVVVDGVVELPFNGNISCMCGGGAELQAAVYIGGSVDIITGWIGVGPSVSDWRIWGPSEKIVYELIKASR